MTENGLEGLRALVERVGMAIDEGEPRGLAALQELEIELVGELAGIPPLRIGSDDHARGVAALASLRAAISSEAQLGESEGEPVRTERGSTPEVATPPPVAAEEAPAELPEAVGRARIEALDAISLALNRFEEATGWLVAEIVVENIDGTQRKIYMKIGKPPE
ncbi:MAG: hypothetical protein ABIV06_01320 [Thermoanaerobaculia bacterium]